MEAHSLQFKSVSAGGQSQAVKERRRSEPNLYQFPPNSLRKQVVSASATGTAEKDFWEDFDDHRSSFDSGDVSENVFKASVGHRGAGGLTSLLEAANPELERSCHTVASQDIGARLSAACPSRPLSAEFGRPKSSPPDFAGDRSDGTTSSRAFDSHDSAECSTAHRETINQLRPSNAMWNERGFHSLDSFAITPPGDRSWPPFERHGMTAGRAGKQWSIDSAFSHHNLNLRMRGQSTFIPQRPLNRFAEGGDNRILQKHSSERLSKSRVNFILLPSFSSASTISSAGEGVFGPVAQTTDTSPGCSFAEDSDTTTPESPSTLSPPGSPPEGMLTGCGDPSAFNSRTNLFTPVHEDFDIHSICVSPSPNPLGADILSYTVADEDPISDQPSPELIPRTDIGKIRQSTIAKSPRKRLPRMDLSRENDEGWSWIVCIACFTIYCIAHGTRFASGVVYDELLKPPCTANITNETDCGGFGQTASTTAWVFSLYSGIIQGLAPLTSRMIKHFGCQFISLVGALILSVAYISSAYVPMLYGLFLTYGVLGGLGACMLYNASILMIGCYFHKKRSLANGIALSGAGFGGTLMTYIASEMIGATGWRGFYQYVTISGVLLFSAAAVFSPKDAKPGKIYIRRHSISRSGPRQGRTFHSMHQPSASGISPQKHRRTMTTRLKGTVDAQIKALRNQKRPRLLVIMTLSFLLYDSVFFIPYFLVPEDTGIGKRHLTYVITSALGFGAILMGLVGNRPQLHPVLLQAISFTCMGLSCMVPIFGSTPASYYVFSIAYGLFNGCAWSLFLPTMVVVLGTTHLRRYIGVIFFIGMLGTVMGPPAAGAIFDSTQSYPNVYILTMALLLCAAGLLFADYIILRAQTLHEQRLLQSSRLAIMMRHLAEETTTSEELEQQPRPKPPPLKERSDTQKTLHNWGRNALGLFEVAGLGDVMPGVPGLFVIEDEDEDPSVPTVDVTLSGTDEGLSIPRSSFASSNYSFMDAMTDPDSLYPPDSSEITDGHLALH